MKINISALFIGIFLVFSANANDLVDMVNSYPEIVEVMPNNLDAHAAKSTPLFSTNDFKMRDIQTTSVDKLMELRGLPDMRCTNKELKSCIVIFGASDGAVIFHLLSGNRLFSHGTIYNNAGKVSNDVIK